MVFTAFPLGAFALLDFDVKQDDGEVVQDMTPFIYLENREYPLFNLKYFSIELGRGIVHGLINYMFLVYTFNTAGVDKNGNIPDIWYFSTVLYTNIILVYSIYYI